MKRVQSVDIVRGIVMVIMALDHCRDMLHANPLGLSPLDLNSTSTAYFMTRWVTHLCATTFAFLSGTSAYLSLVNTGSISKGRSFLIKRGVWLVILNFTLNNFLIFFDIHFGVFFFQVIAVFGTGFIILGLLLSFSPRVIGTIGLIIIFGHNLFQAVSFPAGTPQAFLWALFMNKGFFQVTASHALALNYPIIPWAGIILAGFGFGQLIDKSPEQRRKNLLRIGLGALILFVIIRAVNIYGDPTAWSVQRNFLFSFLSFINLNKYPPSLLFILVTLGISILMMYVFDSRENRFTQIVSVYGKVPLFYWLLHWFTIHIVAIGIFLIMGYHWSDLQFAGFGFGKPSAGSGLHLWGVYIAWASIVTLLYPISKWYNNYKNNNRGKVWLRYL
jgi:uncharacterized membrane protein